MSRQINLFDPAFRKKKDWLSSQNLLLGSLLAVLVISLGAGMAHWSVTGRQQQAQSVNAQLLAARTAFLELTNTLAARKPDAALAAELVDTQSGLDAAQRALGLLRGMTVEGERPVVGEMMRAFARSALEGLWLTGFVVAEGGKQLEIRGRMADQALLPDYLRHLESEPVFAGRRFASLDMRGAEWVPPVQPGAAVEPVKVPEKKTERWFVEFALRTTEIPKVPGQGGGANR
ncbi:MAG: PilN domain-containing protein [Azonexus sp.]